MIEYTKSYRSSSGAVFAALEMAQADELSGLLEIETGSKIIHKILQNKARIVDILKLQETSRPRARKARLNSEKPETPKKDKAKPKVVSEGQTAT